MIDTFHRNRLSLLAPIYAKLISGHPSVQSIVDEIHEELGPDVTSLTMTDWINERQVILAACGVPASIKSVPLEISICRIVVEGGQPVCFACGEKSGIFNRHPAVVEGGLAAYLGVPVNDINGDPLASLCCRRMSPHEWSVDDIEYLESAATRLSLAIAQVVDEGEASQDAARA